MPEAHADHILVRVECAAFTTLLQVSTQHVERFAGTACINQIEPSQRVRPLREMRVAVPQSGNHPYLRSSIRWPFRRSHRSYSPMTDSNVDRLIRTYETHVFNHTRLAHTSSFQRDVLPVPWYPAAAQQRTFVSIRHAGQWLADSKRREALEDDGWAYIQVTAENLMNDFEERALAQRVADRMSQRLSKPIMLCQRMPSGRIHIRITSLANGSRKILI